MTASNSPDSARTKIVSPEIGPLTAKPRALKLLTVGQDHRRVLLPEEAAFAGMGIEGGDADPRMREAEGGERVRR